MKDLEISRTELSNIIDEYVVGKNATRDREILKDNLTDGMSYYDLSEKYQLSQTAIRDILKKRKQKVMKHIKGG